MKINDDILVHLPLKYIWTVCGVSVTVIGFVFFVGTQLASIQNKFDSRILASETQIEDINKELQFRIQLRTQIMNKLDAIEHRLSMIEGRLESFGRDRQR